ncbi:MAG: glycosyltransferase family 4 protein [Pirellulaceae bacterium]
MRIAFVFYDRPDWFGGPAVNARRLLPELQRRGHEVVALIPFRGSHSPAAQYLERHGVQCRSEPRPESTEELVRWCVSQVGDLEPDVFVSNESIPAHFAGRWIRQAGIATIAAHRSDDPFHWGMVEQFVTGPGQWAVSGLVCVAKDIEKKVRGRSPAHTELCTIPSGVPIPARPIASHSPFRIAYVGRLRQKQKRIRHVVRCICEIVAKRGGTEGIIIGDGREAESVQAFLEEYGVEDRVWFAGPIPNEKLHSQLHGASAILLLSDYEGTPGAIMDGMACGLVPICRHIPGGLQELINDRQTGIFVHDDSAVGDAIDALIADPRRWEAISHLARQRIVHGFSLEAAAKKWERFCEQLTSRKQSRKCLELPKKIELPPVHEDTARDDRRYTAKYQQLIRMGFQKTRTAFAHLFEVVS